MCVYRLKKTEGGELVKDPMTGGEDLKSNWVRNCLPYRGIVI